MDEVPLTFDVPSNKTVDVTGAKTIMIKTSGNEKTCYTVVLACCADGTKLPPLLISSISNVCEWVKNCWQRVKSETIVKSLKMCH